MNDLPWCPIYTADFLQETAEMEACETGAYALLLLYQWANGSLPTDLRRLARISRTDPSTFESSVWPILKDKFPPLEGEANALAHPAYAKMRREAVENKKSASERARQAALAMHERRRRDADAKREQSGRNADAEQSQSASTASAEREHCLEHATSSSSSSSPSESSSTTEDPPAAVGGAAPQGADVRQVRERPKEPDPVPLPAPLEPHVARLIKGLADQNRDGKIAPGRIATIRAHVAETLAMLDGRVDLVVCGLIAAVGKGPEYARAVAKGMAKRGDEAPADIKAQITGKRPRPPADFNGWDEPRKNAWLRENGYA